MGWQGRARTGQSEKAGHGGEPMLSWGGEDLTISMSSLPRSEFVKRSSGPTVPSQEKASGSESRADVWRKVPPGIWEFPVI